MKLKQARNPSSRPPGPSVAVRLALGASAILGFTVLAYLPALSGGFIWDDHNHVENNAVLFGPGGLQRIWLSLSAPQYYPLVFTSFRLERALWGVNPTGYHWDNLLLHAANALLVWQLLRRLRVPGAWLAAALFALHPVNVESVAWITERKNTLSMLFFLSSLWCFLRFDGDLRTLQPRACRYGLSLFAFLLALLSKTAVAPLPLVLLGLAWWQRGRIGRRDLLRTAPFFALVLLLVPITILVERHTGSEIVRADPLFARLTGAGCAFWFYLYKAILPLNLMFIYPRWQIDPATPLACLPGLLAVGAFLVLWRFRRVWGRAWLAGLGYFVVMLLPALGLVNIYFMRYSLVSDHWTYFAIIGPLALAAVGITWAVEQLPRAVAWLKPVAGAMLLLTLGVLSFHQSSIYVEEASLWQDTLAKNPKCWMAYCNLGVSFAAQGRLDEAIQQYERALDLEPDFPEAHSNLANELAAQGKRDEAIAHYERALQLEPRYLDAHNNLAVQLARQGRLAEAIPHWERALQIKPDYTEAEYNLGRALAQQGKTAEAIHHFEQALRLAPDPTNPALVADLRAQLERYRSK
jgi:protein O-mannosyl-transferase